MKKTMIVSVLLMLFFGAAIVAVYFLKWPTFQFDDPSSAVEALTGFIEDGQKHGYGYFPLKTVRADRLEAVDLQFRTHIKWSENAQCAPHEDTIVMAQSKNNQSVVCHDGDTVVFFGNGNDWLEDSSGNDIVIGGPGDDVINMSGGNDIFIFQPGWGHDVVNLHTSLVDRNHLIGYDGSYPYLYSSFFIFGQGVRRSDMAWDGTTLYNLKSGDSIKLNTRMINLLFADNPAPLSDANFVPVKTRPRPINLDNFYAESVTIQDNRGYYARSNEGLAIVDLTDIKKPLLLSQTLLSGRAMQVETTGQLAVVAQSDHYLEGKKGWVSILDVSDPRSPKLLCELAYGNNLYNVVLNDNILYVVETHFLKKSGGLHIYDLTRPNRPRLLSSTPVNFYAKFGAYLDQRLYLTDLKRTAIHIYDVSNPQKPTVLGMLDISKQRPWSIKVIQNKRLVVALSKSRFALYEATTNGLKRLGRVESMAPVDGNTGYDTIAVQDNLIFKADGFEGVSISRMAADGECKVIRQISFGKRFMASLYLVGRNLVVYDGDKKASMVSLDAVFQQGKTDIAYDDLPSEKQPQLDKDQLQTLLHKAAVENNPDKIKELCVAGAKPNSKGHERYTPVEISARLGNITALQELLKNGGNPNINKGQAMMLAALNQHMDAIKILAKFGGDIDQADRDGCTTLHYIAEKGTLEMVKYLIEHGVPVAARCRGGEQAIHWATSGKNEPVVRYLKTQISKHK